MKKVIGLPASEGIAVGKVLIYKKRQPIIENKVVNDTGREIEKFLNGVLTYEKKLEKLYLDKREELGEETAEIFNAHKQILQDSEFHDRVTQLLNEKKCCEYAIKTVADSYIEIFNQMDNEYMKQRAADIRDVFYNLIEIILGIEQIDLESISEDTIIIAEDLTPSDTAKIDKGKISGFITRIGGKTSHTAILARNIGLPAIVGANSILNLVKDDVKIVFDGMTGEIYIEPDHEIVKKYQIKLKNHKKKLKKLEAVKGKKSISKDGMSVEISGNIGSYDDVKLVMDNDGDGVGLFRTEFLYMNSSHLPTEEEQYVEYKRILKDMKGKPVILRTLDIGGDKKLPYLNIPEEANPFLGYRAIRLCLKEKEIFKPQLRAAFRASVYGKLKIMIPMISNIEELRQTKQLINEVKEELRAEDIDFDDTVEVGIMVEIPAVAVMSDVFAKEVDFFSIGTNDLIQYTTAVDRMNQNIAHLYSRYHPAVLRLIKMTIENGQKSGIWTGMCGEAASDSKLIPILLGMGLSEFSMSPASILKARAIINSIGVDEMKKSVVEVLSLSTAEEVVDYLENLYKELDLS